jgi:hypothetical protein
MAAMAPIEAPTAVTVAMMMEMSATMWTRRDRFCAFQ